MVQSQAEIRRRRNIGDLARQSLVRSTPVIQQGDLPKQTIIADTASSQTTALADEIAQLKESQHRQNQSDAIEITRLENLIQSTSKAGVRDDSETQIERIVDTRRSRNEDFQNRIDSVNDARRFVGQGFTTSSLINFAQDSGQLRTERDLSALSQQDELTQDFVDSGIQKQRARTLARASLNQTTGLKARQGLVQDFRSGNITLTDDALRGIGVPENRLQAIAKEGRTAQGPKPQVSTVPASQLQSQSQQSIIRGPVSAGKVLARSLFGGGFLSAVRRFNPFFKESLTESDAQMLPRPIPVQPRPKPVPKDTGGSGDFFTPVTPVTPAGPQDLFSGVPILGTEDPTPTSAEIQSQQSLIPSLRNKPISDVVQGKSTILQSVSIPFLGIGNKEGFFVPGLQATTGTSPREQALNRQIQNFNARFVNRELTGAQRTEATELKAIIEAKRTAGDSTIFISAPVSSEFGEGFREATAEEIRTNAPNLFTINEVPMSTELGEGFQKNQITGPVVAKPLTFGDFFRDPKTVTASFLSGPGAFIGTQVGLRDDQTISQDFLENPTFGSLFKQDGTTLLTYFGQKLSRKAKSTREGLAEQDQSKVDVQFASRILGVTDVFAPETRAETKSILFATGALGLAFTNPVTASVVGPAFVFESGKSTFDSDLTLDERIASGLITFGIGKGTYSAIKPKLQLLGAKKPGTGALGEQVFDIKKVVQTETPGNVVGFRTEFKADVPIETTFRQGEINLAVIPRGGQTKFVGEKAFPTLQADPATLASTVEIPKTTTPTLPKLDSLQNQIVDIVRGSKNEIIGGSLSQQALLRQSRGFKDIDILSKDIDITASKIKSQLGDKVTIREQVITDSPLGDFRILKVYDKKGRHIADVDPLAFSEEGLGVGKTAPTVVDGVLILSPETRLISKLQQATRPKIGQERISQKVIEDIKLLSGGKIDLDTPAVKGAFGFTFEKQAGFLGKKVDVTHSGVGLLDSLLGEPVSLVPGKQGFGLFGTPSIDGTSFVRPSRLGLDKGSIFERGLTFNVPGKSQVIMFLDKTIGPTNSAKIARIKDLAKRADAGDAVAKAELFKIAEDLKKTQGEFTGLGAINNIGELEVTLRGSIKREGKIATLNIEGNAVDLIEASVVKKTVKITPSEKLLLEEAIKARDSGTKLSASKKSQVDALVESKTGFKDITRDLGPQPIFVPASSLSGAFSPNISARRSTGLIQTRRTPTSDLFESRRTPTKPREEVRRSSIEVFRQDPVRLIPERRRPLKPREEPRRIPIPERRRVEPRPEIIEDIVTTIPFRGGRLKKKKKDDLRQLYDVYVKKRGQFRKIADDLPRNKALKLGADRTKRTLVAQFLLKKDKFGKKQDIKKFKIDPKEFRAHRIVQGKKVPLPENHFIEIRNRRLSTRSAVQEIGMFPKRKRKVRRKRK